MTLTGVHYPLDIQDHHPLRTRDENIFKYRVAAVFSECSQITGYCEVNLVILHPSRVFCSLRTQTYFRLSLLRNTIRLRSQAKYSEIATLIFFSAKIFGHDQSFVGILIYLAGEIWGEGPSWVRRKIPLGWWEGGGGFHRV